MKLAPVVFAIALGLAAGVARAGGKVESTFLPPARYVDVGDTLGQQEDNLKEIDTCFQKLGDKYLADGQTLQVAFKDIDLAGRPKWFHRGGGDYRIMTGTVDWPRMELHWVLHTPGEAERSGDASLADMNYLWGVRPAGSDAPLYYDKRMAEAWFKKTFGPATAP